MNIKLFDDEMFTKKPQYNIYMNDEQINQKYITGEIRIVTETGRYPLETVAQMFNDKKKYDDNPDYQRLYVWSNKKKSLLIESFIMNIPIPPIFLYEKEYSYYEILDGKQRVSSIVDFYNNKYKLEGLEVWSELNDKYYNELPIRVKEGLDRRYLSSIIMLKESEKDKFQVNKLKKMVFERLNTGGISLSAQESRNAIYFGPFNDKCKELAKNKLFKEIWGFNKIKPQISFFDEENEIPFQTKQNLHMQDVELVLRFFACRQLNNFEGNLNSFLDMYLNQANEFDNDLICNLSKIFEDTIAFAYNLFDGKAFRLYSNKNNKIVSTSKAVKTIYDPLMQVLSQYLENADSLLCKKQEFQQGYINLLIENADEFSGKLQHRASILKRIELFNNFIASLLKD